MKTAMRVFVASALVALLVAGCRGPQQHEPHVRFDEQSVSVRELAARLGLRVDETDETFIVLRNSANTVLIFTHSNGRCFVNGRPIGPVGTVRKADGDVYVPELLVSAIRPHLGVAARVPAPRPRARPRRLRGSIVIDPGHGGRDPGAIHGGIQEKDLNRRVATKVAGLLAQKGVSVTMTRRDDRLVELEDRAAVANRLSADLFVSIHADSAPSAGAEGFTLYIATDASRDSHAAARAIERAMAGTGLGNRGVRRHDYRVLVATAGPAVLIEMGYLTNARDRARLTDPRFQDRLADAIAEGIADYLR